MQLWHEAKSSKGQLKHGCGRSTGPAVTQCVAKVLSRKCKRFESSVRAGNPQRCKFYTDSNKKQPPFHISDEYSTYILRRWKERRGSWAGRGLVSSREKGVGWDGRVRLQGWGRGAAAEGGGRRGRSAWRNRRCRQPGPLRTPKPPPSPGLDGSSLAFSATNGEEREWRVDASRRFLRKERKAAAFELHFGFD
jgi:hypothetical protein